MIELFWVGGPFFMLPLLAGSVLVVTIAIERYRRFRRASVDYDWFLSEIRKAMLKDGPRAGIELADQFPGPIAAAWSAGLGAHRLPLPVLRERMDSVSIAEVQRLEKFLPIVGGIAQGASLIGILGTVWGMIVAFQEFVFFADIVETAHGSAFSDNPSPLKGRGLCVFVSSCEPNQRDIEP